MTTNLSLSRILPDFTDIRDQLKSGLTNKVSWNVLLATDTSSILLESIAATGTMLQNSAQHVYEERFSDTAKLDSTLKAHARTQAVRLTRKQPGKVLVRLTTVFGSPQVVIPKYTQFVTQKEKLFNRESIVVPANGTPVEVELHEGAIYRSTIAGDGTALQTVWVEVPGFVISNTDVLVNVGGYELNVVQDALWHYPILEGSISNHVVWDRTLPTGELELIFGNNQFGYQPALNEDILVTYVVCKGNLSNDPNFAGYPVAVENVAGVNGIALGPLESGVDETPAENYRSAPRMFASYGRAVSMSDHEAIALNYGDIVDAKFLGQRDIAPTVKEYMNVVYCYMLKSNNSQMTTAEFAAFKEWLLTRSGPLDYVQQVMTMVPVNVTANVYIRSSGDPVVIKQAAENAVRALFKPATGYIGRNLYRSDLYDAIQDCSPYVDYVQLLTPTADIGVNITVPSNLSVTGVVTPGATLIPGNVYHYAITAFNAVGETFASDFVSITLPAGMNSVRLQWTRMEGASGYRVYGRTTTTPRKIGGDIAGGVTQVIDSGVAVGVTQINTISTAGFSYVGLNGMTINVYYTART